VVPRPGGLPETGAYVEAPGQPPELPALPAGPGA
jgi:hypothetical protein